MAKLHESTYSPLVQPAGAELVPVLLVGLSPENRKALDAIAAEAGWRLQAAATVPPAESTLRADPAPVIVAEADAEGLDWRTLLERTREVSCAPRLIVCSRLADERLWLEVLNRGGFDVVRTPFVARELQAVVCHAWESWQADQRHAHGGLRQAAGHGKIQI